MPYSYSQLQDIKTRIVRDLSAEQNKLATAKASFSAIATNLTAFQASYTAWAGEVTTLATANPTDKAIQALKAERDLLVAEFATAKTDAQATDVAVKK